MYTKSQDLRPKTFCLHRDQDGTISIITVFATLMLTMLLGMVMNTGRHVDDKIRMQNAADAAAYSGGVVMARAMNTVAFTNHLLCDVFAVTATLREGRDRNSESYIPRILDAWTKVGQAFAGSGFAKFQALGSAIQQEVPREAEMVRTYGQWASSVSSLVLPLMEDILSQELIPKYQRAVVEAFPDIAQTAAMQAAQRNSQPDHGRGNMLGVLWRTNGQPVGTGDESTDRTLPVVDPVLDSQPNQPQYLDAARAQRAMLAKQYLDHWNNVNMIGFDRLAKMTQFGALWRTFTCGYLDKLLNQDYPNSNLPFVIYPLDISTLSDRNQYLEKYCTFISVVYWRKLPEMMPGLFKNPVEPDAQTYAEVHMFVPRPRLVWAWNRQVSGGPDDILLGAVPGQSATLQLDDGGPPTASGPGHWYVVRSGVPADWSLLNQSWNCQLAPATQSALAAILQTKPPLAAFDGQDLKMPNLGGLTSDDIQRISSH
jgi:hypothetical protein